MTAAELAAGNKAAQAFLKKLLGWKEFFVQQYEPQAVAKIVNTADEAPGDVPAKEHAAATVLHQTIVDAGYGSQVTPTQCAALAVAVYQAVLKLRS